MVLAENPVSVDDIHEEVILDLNDYWEENH